MSEQPPRVFVVVPTNRPERMEWFRAAWKDIFLKHKAILVEVHDGDDPVVKTAYFGDLPREEMNWLRNPVAQTSLSDCKGIWRELVYTHNDGVRNLGFLYLAKHWGNLLNDSLIVTLDDDVAPVGKEILDSIGYFSPQSSDDCFPVDPALGTNDPIQEHIGALGLRGPVSWYSTYFPYPRGYPYEVREETDAWVSHGVWCGVPDYDATTQLQIGNREGSIVRGFIPRHSLFPCCGMNLAFWGKTLPYVYFAPMGLKVGVHRFADIWMGIRLKRNLDMLNKAVATGYSLVHHTRASDVYKNLEQEAKGLRWNEWMWKTAGVEGTEDADYLNYRDLHSRLRLMWVDYVIKLLETEGCPAKLPVAPKQDALVLPTEGNVL